jgi:hypothetical protein
MALNQLPDFSYKGEVSSASIIQAYQQKAQQEEQMRMNQEVLKQQKINNVKDIFNQGAGLVSTLMDYNKQKSLTDAQGALTNLLGMGAMPAVVEGETKEYSKTPEYKAELAALVSKAYPKEAGAEVSKFAFDQLGGPKQGTLSGRDVQQKNVILEDGTRMSLQLLETTPSEKYGTQFTWTDYSGNEIDPNILTGAVEAPMPGTSTDQFGNPIIFEKVGRGGARKVPTSVPQETSAKTKEEDSENAFIRLQQKAPKLAAGLQESVGKTTLNNSEILANVTTINAAEYASSILDDPEAKETELKSVYTYIARAVEKGALTEADKAAFSEPLSIVAKGENFFYRTISGSAGPTFKKSLSRLQKRLSNRGKLQLRNKINSEKLVAKKRLGKTWEKGLDSLYPTPEELVIQAQDLDPDGASGNAEDQQLNDLLKELINE